MKTIQSLKDRRRDRWQALMGRLGALMALLALPLMPLASRATAQDSPASGDKASTPTATAAATPTPSPTPVPTATPTPIPTATPTPSPSPTATPTPKPTATPTPVPTATPTPTPKPSPIPVTTPTPIPVVKLNPVLKAAPETVTLSPIIRKDEIPVNGNAAPAAKPKATPTPEATSVPEVKPKAAPTPEATPAPETEAAPAAQLESPTKPEPQPKATPVQEKVEPAAPAEPAEPANAKPATPAPPETSAPAPAAQELDAEFGQALAEPAGGAARSHLRQLVVAHPEHPLTGDALVRIGEISMEMNEPTEALMALKAAAQSGKPRPDLLEKAQNALLTQMMNAGDLVGASRQYVAFARQDPALKDAPDTQAAQAFLATIDGDYAQAAGQWQALAERIKAESAVPAQPANQTGAASPVRKPVVASEAAALAGQALCEELAGRAAQARQDYQRVLDQFPDSPEASIVRDRLADLDRSILK